MYAQAVRIPPVHLRGKRIQSSAFAQCAKGCAFPDVQLDCIKYLKLGEETRGSGHIMTADELFFFNGKESALPLYAAFRGSVLDNLPDTRIEAKKTQISFFNRHLFAAVSFTPVRKAKDRSDPFLTITFGLPYRKESPRIDAAVEPYPHRWTHHVMIGAAEEIDDELLSWIAEAAAFGGSK